MGTVRFLLAMCVVATHYPGGSIFGIVPLPGPTAVQAFYVISGFLITMVLSERADYTNVRKFYISRYLRLWPVYATVASIQLYLVWPQYLIKLAENNLTAAYLVFTNLVIFGQDLALFLRFDEGGGLAFTSSFASWPGPQVNNYLLVPQAWSLGIELAFYVIAPFFCRRMSTTLLLFIFGASARVVVHSFHPIGDAWSYRFFPCELMLFAAGGLAYHFGSRLGHITDAISFRLLSGSILVGVSCAIIFDASMPSFLPRFSGALGLYNPVFLLTAVAACPILFFGTRHNAADRLLGELSYPIYICHILVSGLLARFLGYLPASYIYAATVVIVSIGLLIFVSIPVDHIRARFGARAQHVGMSLNPAAV